MRSFRPWLALSIGLLATAAGAATLSAPQAVYRPEPTAKPETSATLLTPETAPRYVLGLPEPSSAEKAALGTSAESSAGPAVQRRRLKIGFARALRAGERPLPMSALPWQSLGDGGTAARIEVVSPGAKAIRLAVELKATAPGVALRFAGSARPDQVFGPYAASAVARQKRYWSPVLEGDRATLEIYLPRGVPPSTIVLALPQLSHLARTAQRAEPVSEIGQAAACEQDVACVATPPILAQAKAVAKLFFTDQGASYLCTGTLINDSVSSNTPYLLTGSHCIDSQAVASTLQTYWFFDAVACGSRAVPPYATVAGGAKLLARSDDNDWALLQLSNPPPAGATLSAWRAEFLPAGIPIGVAHHPEGDLKKYSEATSAGPGATYLASGSYNLVTPYTIGATEPGSSGAALLTMGPGGMLEVRGALFAGGSSCARQGRPDYYSRLDLALPLIASYLTPGAPSAGKGAVVEFYHAGLDDYFMTANPAEISDLDSGVHPGWVRTGLRFLAYTDAAFAPAGASPVCRFYVLPQYGDSHFYSADPNECAQTAARFSAQWVYETPAAFYIELPDTATGACPANTHPVYRFMNRANQLHHRYTAEADLRNCLYYGVSQSVSEPDYCSAYSGQWVQEGYGQSPNATVMCSPDS